MHGHYPDSFVGNCGAFNGVFFGNEDALRINLLKELRGLGRMIR